MLRFWGQPKYADQEMFAYELFLREYSGAQWRFPRFSALDATAVIDLLIATVRSVAGEVQMVSINLDQPEFVRADYQRECARAQRACPGVQLCVELTERPYGVAVAALAAAAAAYQQAGLWVCIDDVGTGANDPELVHALAPSVTEVKFALQNFHDQKDFITRVSPVLQFWREQASVAGVFFAIEGFETAADLTIAANYQPDIMQGYYFGRPHLIQLGGGKEASGHVAS